MYNGKIKMRINKFGIWFIHAKRHPVHNDEVCWIWPWRRKLSKGKKILSIGFNNSFESFKELDELWEDYAKAMAR
ncbi:unnamed protein product [marine sediment metagenome]|uniref:Uncharacterized protein n=1 Tax=marine sediment metagenome TaxID=412755 RepID=X1SGK1_9ZZZZ